MNYKEFLKMQQKEIEFLDSIDLMPLIILIKDVDELICYIEGNYGEYYKDEDYIFNCIDTETFMNYLKNRYKDIIFDEYVSYHIRFVEGSENN